MTDYDYDSSQATAEKTYDIELSGRRFCMRESVLTTKISEIQDGDIPPNIKRTLRKEGFRITVHREGIESMVLKPDDFIEKTHYRAIGLLAQKGALNSFEQPSTIARQN